MLEGNRKLIGFVVLMLTMGVLSITGDLSDDVANALYHLFLLFVGGNLGEHGVNAWKASRPQG